MYRMIHWHHTTPEKRESVDLDVESADAASEWALANPDLFGHQFEVSFVPDPKPEPKPKPDPEPDPLPEPDPEPVKQAPAPRKKGGRHERSHA